jgi:hypothetical protein
VFHGGTVLLEHRAQALQLCRRAVHRSQTGCHAVHQQHRAEVARDCRHVEGRDDRTAVAQRLDQALAGQADQGLANRRARDFEARGQFGLVEQRARREPQRKDVGSQVLVDVGRSEAAAPPG